MKKDVFATGGEAVPSSRPSEPPLAEDCEKETPQESRKARSPSRRGAARATVGNSSKRVVLIGANVLLREGLARILNAADFHIVASIPCPDPDVMGSLPQDGPLLFVIDVSDDFDTGLIHIAQFRRGYPEGRIVVLADPHQSARMPSAFQAGANAYLVKATTRETFVKSLELVMLGVTLLPPEILNLISDRQAGRGDRTADDVAGDGRADNGDSIGRDEETIESDDATSRRSPEADGAHAPRLSDRQLAILHCLAEGDSNKTIARKMAMAEATVKVHVKAILQKIRVHNRTQAAIWAMNSNPPVLARDDFEPSSQNLPVSRFSDLKTIGIPSEQHKNGSTSSTGQPREGSDVTIRVPLRLVPRTD
jgi:two-component system, NarL family, nitrate/nitrite response regulator NarL